MFRGFAVKDVLRNSAIHLYIDVINPPEIERSRQRCLKVNMSAVPVSGKMVVFGIDARTRRCQG